MEYITCVSGSSNRGKDKMTSTKRVWNREIAIHSIFIGTVYVVVDIVIAAAICVLSL